MHMKYKYSDAAAVVDAGVAKSARNKHEFFFYFCTRRFIALAAQLLRETERESESKRAAARERDAVRELMK